MSPAAATRPTQATRESGPISEARGMTGGTDIDKIKASMDARCNPGEASEKQRAALREAIAFKKYEFDAHGVEMNQRYRSDAVLTDDQVAPGFERDAELHYQPTTWPGARLPHVWVFDHDSGAQVSTLDLCGHGAFTVLTGIGGEPWLEAAEAEATERGLAFRAQLIGPRQALVVHTGDGARASEIEDTGCLLVRPDHHVAWRAPTMPSDPRAELARALDHILAKA